MMDIVDIGADILAVEAAERGDFTLLAEMVLAEKPLSDKIKQIIADRLTGKFKAKRGTKPTKETVTRNKDIYLEFLFLRQTGKCASNDDAYAKIAHRTKRKTEGIRKAVRAGRRATSHMGRYLLNDME